MRLRAFCVICVSLLPVARTSATPSTLIWIPSTDIQAAEVAHLGVDVYLGPGSDPARDFGVTFGTGRIEYGIDYLEGLDDPFFFNAKILLRQEGPGSPRLAAGVMGVGVDSSTSANVGYLLASKSGKGGRVTVGCAVGRHSVLGEDNVMFLAGFDKCLNERWWLGIDYQSGESSLGAFNAGVAYNFTKSSSLIVGYDWYNNKAVADTFTLQWDWNF